MRKTTKWFLSLMLVAAAIFGCMTALAATAPALPTATVTEIKNENLTFALNFSADQATEEQLAYYGSWYADFELTTNKDITLYSGEGADGYLGGQYDGSWEDENYSWNGQWVYGPFKEPVTIKAGQTVKVMAYAAEMMGEPGLKYTYKEVYEVVKNFDCGMFITEEYMQANPDFEVTLGLHVYNNTNEAERYLIGRQYTFRVGYVAQNVQTGVKYYDVSDAMQAASNGQTVKLLNNAEDIVLTVKENTILDLNGFELTVNYASVFGHMVDDSTANTGALKVEDNKLLINTNNKQLPIKTSDGYRFVEVIGFNAAWMNETTFVFQPLFEASAHELLKNGVAATGVTIQVNVTWRPYAGSEDLDSRTFSYGDKLVTQYINAYNASTGKYGRMLTLTLINPENYVELACNPQVVSTTRVVFAPASVPAEVTEEVLLANEQASAIVPVGTKLKNADSELTLTTEELDTTTVVVGEGEEARSMDIHVDGLAEDNTVPVIVTVNEMAPEFMNRGNIALYHIENGEAMEMTRVYTIEEVDEHNEYYYDIETGSVTMAVANFSEFVARTTKANTWNGIIDTKWYNTKDTSFKIANADQLAGFGAIVGGMAEGIEQDSFEGKTVTLIADINIGDLNSENGYMFYPIGYWNSVGSYVKQSDVSVSSGYYTFCGTFDGNGHTISDFYQNTWEAFGDYNDGYSGTPNHNRDGFGLFGRVYKGTVKNLTVKNFSSDGEYATTGCIAAYADGATFENISVFGCNPRVYNIGNGGIVGCVGWYAKEAELKTTFKNITVDNSNKITALWGSWDVACGGILGQYYPTSGQSAAEYPVNGGIHFENCHVAAQIDVYNDVCANYQYYAYRYAGMLIGSVRENVTGEDGRSYPKMDGITATGCTIKYGDWVNYYYCELVANSIASYTHDHQFSRLTQVQAVEGTTITPLEGEKFEVPASGRYNYVVVNGDHSTENATCYHFVDGTVWEHKDAGTETVGGKTVLKEDNQHIYLPFNQLFTGYGWGVTSKGLSAFGETNVTIGNYTSSINKFQKAENAKTTYATGTTVTVGELFKLLENVGVGFDGRNVQMFVSPADETSTVSGTYTAGKTWTEGALTFSGTGAATITITDYYFCNPFTINVNVVNAAKIGNTEYPTVQEALDAAQDGETVTLLADVEATKYLDVYTDGFGATERSFTLDLAGNSITWGDNYKYQWYPLVFVGINQTLTITNGSIIADEHVAVGAYGTVNLENVNVSVKNPSKDEQAVCIWNWSESDEYYKDCEFLVTGSATITGGEILGGILVEGPVTLNETAGFDKLYLNNSTAYGNVTLPKGYGMVKENTYYINLHEHIYQDNTCTECGHLLIINSSYVKTDLENIKSTDVVVITMSKDGTTWAMSNVNGASDGPAAVVVDVNGNKLAEIPADSIKWNIGRDSDGYIIYPNGEIENWLYCTNTNDGVRVGTGNAKHFTVENSYLKISETAAARYIGVYNSEDWRCYEISKGYSNIKDQTIAFYVLKTDCAHTNTEKHGAVAANCIQAGHAAGTYCLNCDSYVEGGDLIVAVGHAFGDYRTTKEPTCTEKGKAVANCTVCNKMTTKSLDSIGHSWDDGEVTTAPGCETTGVKTFKCTVVDCTGIKEETIEANGHTEVNVAGKEATCTEPGLTEGKQCSVCGTVTVVQKTIPAPGHNYAGGTCVNCDAKDPNYNDPVEQYTVTFHVPAGSTAPAALTVDKGVEIQLDSVSGVAKYDFAGWAKVADSATEPTLKAGSKIIVNENIDLYAVYSQKKAAEYTLVTKASELVAGDEVVIVAKDYDYALSTEQKTNNRGQTAVEKIGNTVAINDTVQKLTLEPGTKSGTWAFYTGSGYLYAASSSSNNLKTQTTKNDNGSWEITIAADGTATVKAKGTNTRNVMQYNQSSSLFACYGSASQKALCIYKLGEDSVEYTTNPSGQGGDTAEAIVVLDITKDDFNGTSYAANNNTKKENGYSYTSYQVMNQSGVMQWKKGEGYITIGSNGFTELRIKVTQGTFTVTVGGTIVNGQQEGDEIVFDLTGKSGQIKIAVSNTIVGYVEYLKFYK